VISDAGTATFIPVVHVGATMGKSDNYHVVPQDKGWAVKKQNAARASSTHDTKAEAVKAGRAVAKRNEGSLRIHKKDGTIQEERTYRDDPYPPKG
jgi:hypothetical protein